MKKIILIFISLFIALLFFVQPINTLAVEGTCSWHGGVDCSAGADWDGSAICNDGWTDSSEVFSSILECKADHHSCTQSERNQIDMKYGVAEKGSKMNDLYNQINTLKNEAAAIPIQLEQAASNGGVTTGQLATQIAYELKENSIKTLALSGQYDTAQRDYWNALNQADKECYALGDAEYQKSQQEFLKTLNTPHYTCPANSIVSGDKCVCNDGYIWNGSLCVTYVQNCQTQFGTNSYGDKQGCYCSNGYAWNLSKTTCNKIEVQSAQPPLIPVNPPAETINISKEKQREQPTSTIGDKESEKIITNETTTISLDKKAEGKNEAQSRPSFFSRFFGSIKSFFSRIFK